MTPFEFTQARKALGLSAKEMAEALKFNGDGARHIRRLESGNHTITGPVSVAVNYMLKYGLEIGE